MEYIDVLNSDGELSGTIVTRDEVHKKGYWHRVIHILIINSQNEILLQKRSANKEKHPNLWDISCAGHLSIGDTSIEGALREMKEEIGITTNKEDLELIYTIKRSYIPKQGFIENEIQDVYLYKKDIDLKDIKIQEEEVSEVKFVPFELYKNKILKKDEKYVDRGNEYKDVIEIIDKKINQSKCKLVIFSDIHYAPEKPVNNGSIIDRKLMEYSIPLIEQLIDRINKDIRPDIVVNLGDLIEDFKDHDKDIVNIKFIWRILKKLNMPFYSLAGNHDLRSMNSRIEVEEIMGYDHSTFSVDMLGYHFVFLGLDVNTKMGMKSGGILKTQYISNDDIQWLKKDLEKNKLPCLIFVHFGIAEDDMKGNWWFEDCPNQALLANRGEIKEILKNDRNLIAVFSGHQHWTKKLLEDGINYYVVGSLTEDIKNDGIPDGVYFEVELNGKEIEIKEKHLKIVI